MSTPFLVLAAVLVAAVFVAGCVGLVLGMDRLFFTAAIGAVFAGAFVYFGAFMQSLRQPPPAPSSRPRTVKEELQAMREVNPDRPGLKRIYIWLLALVGVVVGLRIAQLIAP